MLTIYNAIGMLLDSTFFGFQMPNSNNAVYVIAMLQFEPMCIAYLLGIFYIAYFHPTGKLELQICNLLP